MSFKQVSDLAHNNKERLDALKTILDLDTRTTSDGTEYIAITLPDGNEYKMLAASFFAQGFRTIDADADVVASDANGTILVDGNNITLTIPEGIGWNLGRELKVIVNGTGFTLAAGGAVIINSPQAFQDVNNSVYEIAKTTTNEYSVVQKGAATGGGVSTWGSITGTLSDQTDLQTALGAKEDDLGNPSTDNYVLSSTIAGVRSWVPQSGGASTPEYQTPITTVNTDLDGTQVGSDKIYPFSNTSNQTANVGLGAYSVNDPIFIQRRGPGGLQITWDAGVEITGKRTFENEYHVADVGSTVMLKCYESNKFYVEGNLRDGYLGPVETTAYGNLSPTETNKVITVRGKGFSDNMQVSVSKSGSGTVTLEDFTVSSDQTEFYPELSVSGTEGDTLTFRYFNGQETTDTDAITLTNAVEYLSDNHAPFVAYALFKVNSTQTYCITLRRTSDGAATNVGFDPVTDEVSLNSPVSAGETLGSWSSGTDCFITTWWNQGTGGSTFDWTQNTDSKQAKLITNGVLITNDGVVMAEYDGVDDEYATGATNAWCNNDITCFSFIRVKSLHVGMLMGSFDTSPNRNFQYRVNDTGVVRMVVVNSSGSASTADSPAASISVDTNYKTAGWRNGTNFQVSVEGTAGTNGTIPSNRDNAMAMTAGDIASGGTAYNGFMNHNIFYKTNKSADESTINTIISNFL